MTYKSIKPLIVDAVQVRESKDVPTPGGMLHVNAGDWLIFDAQGNLTRCADIDFKATYERFDTRTTLQQLREGKPCGC